MPKKYFVERENRLFSLRELLANGGGPAAPSAWTDYSKRHGLRIEDNTEDEIRELALEALGRIDGTWVDSEDDVKRRAIVRALYENQPLELGGPFKATLSASFLRKYPEFLS